MPQVILNKFGGARSEYRVWRNEAQALLLLRVPEEERVLLVYFALEQGCGCPRDLFSSLDVAVRSQLPPSDMWKPLDTEY